MAITQEELGMRLRRMRLSYQLTQERVAAHLGLSRPTIFQIESGNRSVSSLELERLADLFGRDIRELLSEDPFQEEDALVALFRAQPQVAGQERMVEVLRQCMRLGQELTNLEELLGIEPGGGGIASYSLRLPKSKWEAIQQGERAAAEERRRLDLGSSPIENVAELLERHGVRTAWVELPEEISGLTLRDAGKGLFVIVNRAHHWLRRRFSFAHEYAHALLDADRLGTISKASDRDNLREVRANAFAATLLQPREGIEQFIAGLGKGKPSRIRAEVFDVFENAEALTVEARTEPGSQAIQLYDAVLLAHHFGVSRQSALYRLRNLRLLTEAELQALLAQETAGRGAEIAAALGLEEPDHTAIRYEFTHRFAGLALEAYRRERITRSKVLEIAALAGFSREEAERLLQNAGLDESEGVEVVLPGPCSDLAGS